MYLPRASATVETWFTISWPTGTDRIGARIELVQTANLSQQNFCCICATADCKPIHDFLRLSIPHWMNGNGCWYLYYRPAAQIQRGLVHQKAYWFLDMYEHLERNVLPWTTGPYLPGSSHHPRGQGSFAACASKIWPLGNTPLCECTLVICSLRGQGIVNKRKQHSCILRSSENFILAVLKYKIHV